MFQFYGSSASSGVWILPGSHKGDRCNIKEMIQANDGSNRLPGTVPLVCEPGDVVLANRQTLQDRRVTFNFGFHRRASVLNVKTHFFEKPVVYDDEYIHERARLIAVAIDACQQRFPPRIALRLPALRRTGGCQPLERSNKEKHCQGLSSEECSALTLACSSVPSDSCTFS